MRIPLIARPPQLIAPPANFTLTPPCRVWRRHDHQYFHDFKIAANRPAVSAQIFVGAGGVNTNDGLTHATRVRSIKVGISKANALAVSTQILIDPGTYLASQIVSSNADNWSGFNPTVDLIIEPNGAGTVYSIADVTMPAFVASGITNLYTSTYTSQSPSRTVIDKTNLDPNGMPSRLWRVNTVANAADPSPELNAAWANGYGAGAMWLDTTNKILWVRCFDNRAPDANIIVLGGTQNGVLTNTSGANRTLYMKNLALWGGTPVFKVTSSAGNAPKVYRESCQFGYAASENASSWVSGGGQLYSQSCIGGWADQDIFNVHGISNAQCPDVFDFDSKAYQAGFDDSGINNCYTGHELCRGMYINPIGFLSADRCFNFIDGSLTWLVNPQGSCRRGKDSTETSAIYAAATGNGQAAKVWVDGAIARNGQYDVEAYTGSQLLTTRWSPASQFGGGTIGTYH